MVALATVFSVWVREAQAEGKAGHRGRARMLSENQQQTWLWTSVTSAQNKRTGKINQIKILTWVLTAEDSFGGFGAEGFSCLLVFGHYKPKKLHSVSYAAVLEFQLHEGGNAAWVFPCVGMVGVSCGLWCIQYSRVSLRSGWYFYSDHNGCNRFLDLPAGYKSSRTPLALLMWSRQ